MENMSQGLDDDGARVVSYMMGRIKMIRRRKGRISLGQMLSEQVNAKLKIAPIDDRGQLIIVC